MDNLIKEDSLRDQSLEDGSDLFYFESSYLAIKGNKDYHALMKTLVVLEAQKEQALNDLKKLERGRSEACIDPIGFVEKLHNSNSDIYPQRQKLAEIPNIDWTKYNINSPKIMESGSVQSSVTKVPKTKTEISNLNEKEKRIETPNQFWTEDEQYRLEELLALYPPETIEMNRWTKIAKSLGNRTPKQVASRVQKYFTKLSKSGQFVPEQESKHRNNTRERHKAKKAESESNNSLGRRDSYFRIVQQIQAEHRNKKDLYLNLGYQCYICGDEPLKGTRWHCTDCPRGVDLCGNCVIQQIKSDDPIHPPEHNLSGLRPPTYSEQHDDDYKPQNFNNFSYNYLDPNFLPS